MKRFVVVVDLDDEKLTDRERDLFVALGTVGERELALRRSFEAAFPSLSIFAVSETEVCEVRL